MKLNHSLRASTVLLAALAFCIATRKQTSAQENPPAASPPRYINFVHERLKPGREAAYGRLLGEIRDRYERFNIPAYWVELRSLTGPDEMAALNFFDSFAEIQNVIDGIGAGVGAHPELARLQGQLLEENVSSVTNLIAVRVDAFGSRGAPINIAKMRLLELTVYNIRPGHEAEFAEAAQIAAAAYEKVEERPPWAIYKVVAGSPAPAFLMLTALGALKDEDAAAIRRAPAEQSAGLAVGERLQEIAGAAYDSVESNIYLVNPQLSHVPKNFAALDPDYWTPKRATIARVKNTSSAPSRP
jgi:hypothetical protein